MVADAQRSRAPIQKLVDVVTRYFVLIVMACSIAAFVGWAIDGGRGTWRKRRYFDQECRIA